MELWRSAFTKSPWFNGPILVITYCWISPICWITIITLGGSPESTQVKLLLTNFSSTDSIEPSLSTTKSDSKPVKWDFLWWCDVWMKIGMRAVQIWSQIQSPILFHEEGERECIIDCNLYLWLGFLKIRGEGVVLCTKHEEPHGRCTQSLFPPPPSPWTTHRALCFTRDLFLQWHTNCWWSPRWLVPPPQSPTLLGGGCMSDQLLPLLLQAQESISKVVFCNKHQMDACQRKALKGQRQGEKLMQVQKAVG